MFSIFMKRSRDALLALALGLFGLANAEGPVGVAALPGGGGTVVSDTDVTEGGGLGQRWGRAGGRTITYHVNNPSAFSALVFGVVQGTAPSLAFDGAVTSATGEIMSYNPGQSNLAAGIARWTGFANLPLAFGGVGSLPTRFTLTVTRTNGTAVPLGADPSGPNPMASVLATGDFRVNLLFEMQDLGNPGIFRPVLDYYDSLATPAGQPPSTNTGPVMTGVNTGFYYTVADTDMTIEEHDAHVQALFDVVTPKIDNIDGKINFLHTDWEGRIPAIQSRVGDVFSAINNNVTPALSQIQPTLSQIQAQVAQLLGQGSGTGNLATRDDVNNAKNSLNEILMIMLGFAPCPSDKAPAGFCTNFGNLKKLGGDTSQILINLDGILIGLNNALVARIAPVEAKIDELQLAIDHMASPSLEVQALQIAAKGSKQSRWLVKTTRDGVMVNGVLIGLGAVDASSTPAATLADVLGQATVVSIATGLYEVTVPMGNDAPAAYLFKASLAAAGATIHGATLVEVEKK